MSVYETSQQTCLLHEIAHRNMSASCDGSTNMSVKRDSSTNMSVSLDGSTNMSAS